MNGLLKNKLIGLIFIFCIYCTLLGCPSSSSGSKSSGGGITTLTRIEISPTNINVPRGVRVQLTATGIYSNNTKKNLTNLVTWSVGNTSIATVSNTSGSVGILTPIATGNTTITAVFNSQSGQSAKIKAVTVTGSVNLIVNNATLVSIQVSPTNPNLPIGFQQQFTAIGIFSNGQQYDITLSVVWASSSPSAIISNAQGSQGLATSVSTGPVSITATFPGSTASGGSSITVTNATLVGIQVTPQSAKLSTNTTTQYVATGIFSDQTKLDISNMVAWSSSNQSVATVDNIGIASTLQAGSTNITATLSGKSGQSSLTVTNAVLQSIQITPVNEQIPVGINQIFIATGIYSDGSTNDITNSVIWITSDVTIATIGNATGINGVATSIAAGTTIITAAFSGITSNSSNLKVTSATLSSIQITPTSVNLPVGVPQQFSAIAVYSDNTTEVITNSVIWNTSNATIATIGNATGINGLITPILAGSTNITASLNGITSNSVSLTVTSATLVSIAVTPQNPNIPSNLSQQFTATGTYSDNTTYNITSVATWTSSNLSVAIIGNASGINGLTTSIGAGTTIITASYNGKTSSTNLTLTVTAATLKSISITPTNPIINFGTTKQFTATGTYSDNTTYDITSQVTWSVSDATIATVSNAVGNIGLAKASSANPGTIAVTATFPGTSISGTTNLTISSTTLSSIVITATNATTPISVTQIFTAVGTYSDGTTQNLTTDPNITWSSSSSSVAFISNAIGSQGVVTPLATGTTTIKATWSVAGATQVISNSVTFTVTNNSLVSIAITVPSTTAALGTTKQFTATGTYSNGSKQDLSTDPNLTWSSSNTSIATISNATSKGLATPIAIGTTSITAVWTAATPQITSNAITFTVSAATLVSIAITPITITRAPTQTQQFVATGTYSDNTTQVLTTNASLTWQSSNTSNATISNAGGTKGIATAVAAGSSNITALWTASTPQITSNAATFTILSLTSINITPSSATINGLGNTQQYTATGTFSDSSTLNISSSVNWNSSSNSVAYIDSNGLATASTNGTTTISATSGAITSNSASLTVSGSFVYVISPGLQYCPYVGGLFTNCNSITSATASGITYRSTNNVVYIADYGINGIRWCNQQPDGTLASCNQITGSFNINPPLAGLYFQTSNYIMVANPGNNTVSACPIAGDGSPFPCTAFNNGNAPGSNFSAPRGIVGVINGQFYVVNSGNNTLTKCSIDGAANLSSCSVISNPLPGGISMNFPTGIGYDPAGNVYPTIYIANTSSNSLISCSLTGSGSINTCISYPNLGGLSFNQPVGVYVKNSQLWVTNQSSSSNAFIQCSLFTGSTPGLCSATGGNVSSPVGLVIVP